MSSVAEEINRSGQGRSFSEYLASLHGVLDFISSDAVARGAAVLTEAVERSRQIFVMGNGGSAATASHFVCDLHASTRARRLSVKAVALADNTALLTALANDAGYEEVFTLQLERLLGPGDVVVAITVSGNSSNLVQALARARTKGATTIGLLGGDGGRALASVDVAIHVPSSDSGMVETAHLAVVHGMADSVRHALGGCASGGTARGLADEPR